MEVYEYLLKGTDGMSGTLKKITGAAEPTIRILSSLDRQGKELDDTIGDLGNGIGTLHRKIELLRAERDILPKSNIAAIRQYNREIERLTREVSRLESIGRGGLLKDAFRGLDNITGGLLSNPLVVAGGALFSGVKKAMSADQSMAQINLTAQLDEKSLKDLKKKIQDIAKDNYFDMSAAPEGFEKILSQLGSVDASLPILDAAMKGTMAAGLEDINVVAGALAQTMSILGDRAEAMDVLDTFFASKRVGAGEFADFAKYMPNLIAGADNLGIAYKEVAGVYAYMTGKGQSAEKAAVLMENMFSMLGRGEIRKNLEKIGVQVFDDEGKIRSMVDVFGELKSVSASMTDEQRSSMLEGLGIVDKEAKNAFSIMMSDTDKLSRSLTEVANSAGETERNLAASDNVMRELTKAWNTLKNILTTVGEAVLPIINIGLKGLLFVLEGVQTVITPIVDAVSWWFAELIDGNPYIITLTASIAALTLALNAATIATKAKALWDGIAAGATSALSVVTGIFNATLWACPITWIIASVAALVAGLIYLYRNFDQVKRVMLGVWEVVKELGKALWDSLISTVKNLIGGLGSLGSALYKLFTGDFEGAWKDAKDGAEKLFQANPVTATLKFGAKVSEIDYSGAWARGVAKVPVKTEEEKKADPTATPVGTPAPTGTSGAAADVNSVLSSLAKGKSKSGGGKSGTINLDSIAASVKGSTAYEAIAAKLRPVRIAAAGMAASALAATPAPVTFSDTAQTGREMAAATQKPKVSMEKFCDTVEIHIANADGQGEEEIRRVVVDAITSIIDDGEYV